jgi:hypothetical protein
MRSGVHRITLRRHTDCGIDSVVAATLGPKPPQHRACPGTGPNLPVVHFLQTVPEEIIDRVPEELRDRADEIVGEVSANPVLLAMLVIAGVLTVIMFVWGVTKQAFKAAAFAALAGAGVWYWYFSIR